MRKSILSISGILILAVILLLINGISKTLFGSWYIDLTQDRLYSVSAGTRNILDSIEDPITLRLFYSKTEGAKYPAISLYGRRIADLLRSYQRRSHGKLKLEIYDPRPDSEEEEWAQKYGLSPISTRSGEVLFLGLTGVNSDGEEESIPMFNLARQEFLEYDITRLVYSLVHIKKPVIAVLSTLDISGKGAAPQPRQRRGADDAWFFYTQLKQFGKVRDLPLEVKSIDNDVDELIVVHPKKLSDATLYAIDQYVMRGGNLLVLEDPDCESDQPKEDENNPMAAMSADRSSSLDRILGKWGVLLVKDKVAGDKDLATRVNAGPGGELTNFVLWLSLEKQNMNQDDYTTGALSNIVLPWSGALDIVPTEGVTVQPLLQTTKQAKLFEKREYQFVGANVDDLLKNYVPGGKQLVLAARISGHLKSSFPQGMPQMKPAEGQPADAQTPKTEHLAESKKIANVVVVADVDFINDNYSISSQNLFGTPVVAFLNDNLVFAENVVENLAGSNDLISIRSRGHYTRPFTRVREIEENAQMKWHQEETVLQAKLAGANQRLMQLQNATGSEESKKQVLDKAVLDELKKYRDERAKTQERLREVRRNLRQDKERLGQVLFFLNTFLVPLILIIVAIAAVRRRSKRIKTNGQSANE